MEYVFIAIALVLGAVAGSLGLTFIQNKRRTRLKDEAETILSQARSEAAGTKDKAREELRLEEQKLRHELEEETQVQRRELRRLERRLERHDSELEQQRQKLTGKEKTVDSQRARLEVREQELQAEHAQVEEKVKAADHRLLELAELSPAEAREIVMKRFEQECEGDLAKFLAKHEEVKRERSEELAQRIVGTAIQRCAVRYTCETVTSVIDLPSDEMKGRIIGREGRNIRAIEKATGVDVIVDDTPGVIVVSCFDAVRREIARKTLESLIQDGRIHPARVEELVENFRKEVDDDIRKTGRQVCQELQLARVHPQVQFLVGRLKYRTSYGQNVLQHSIEVAHIMSSMAAELKMDPVVAKRCGLLHDIGKALTHELDGSHAVIGAEQARRFDEPRRVWNAIGAHHEDMPYESVYAVLTQVGDAISAARPGARRDTIERYIERLEKLEKTATDFEGVSAAYALQAGRELRVLVDADKMSDEQAMAAARAIAKKIEDELTYPGEIKVTLVRERRVTEVAR